MRAIISLSVKKANELKNLLKKVDKKSIEYRKVLFKLDPDKGIITLVAGNAMLMSSLKINDVEIDSENINEIIYCSFDADIVLDGFSGGETTLEILLHKEANKPVEMTFPKLTKLRRAFAEEPDSVHLEYFKILENDNVTEYKKDDLLGLVQLVDEKCKPFEYILLNSEKDGGDSVKVQRDGEVHCEEFGTKTHLGIEICLDKKTINTLEDICVNSDDDKIGIRIDHESIVFKLKDSVTSVSIPDYSEFLSKAESKKETIIGFVLNAYELKAELKSYVNMHNIKQQEQSYLLFFKGKLIVCAKSEKLECANMLNLLGATSDVNNLALMVNLHLFKELNVKDVTEFHESKASITKSLDGEYCFSFFHSSDPRNAYFSVPCIAAPSHLDEVKELYRLLTIQLSEQKKSTKKQVAKEEGEQFELLDFSELLEV